MVGSVSGCVRERRHHPAVPQLVASIVDDMTRRKADSANEGRDLLSVPEVAPQLDMHADTLYRLCRTGQFPPAIQIGSRWFISRPRLDRYLHGEVG